MFFAQFVTGEKCRAGVKQNFETRWIGWAGVSVQDDRGRASLTEALALKVGLANFRFLRFGLYFLEYVQCTGDSSGITLNRQVRISLCIEKVRWRLMGGFGETPGGTERLKISLFILSIRYHLDSCCHGVSIT